MDFRFTSDPSPSRINEVVDFMLKPRLWIPQTDYPDFHDWSQKVWRQLLSQEKQFIIGLQGRETISVAVYQQHSPGVIEIKNLSVDPVAQGRYIASFLLRNVEIEGKQSFNATSVVCDAKASNHAVRRFLVAQGYRAVDKRDIYGLGSGEDIVYRKSLVIRAPRLV